MKAEEFLQKWRLGPEFFDMETVCNEILTHMSKGLYSEESSSSLPMIPTFTSDESKISPGESVIVLDAGGTNFRTCLVTFDKDKSPAISDFQKTKMPGFDREVSSEEFFQTLADYTQNLLPKSRKIGFCFSYAARITPDLDGIPLVFSKEIKASQVVGKRLGKELFAEFARRGEDTKGLKICVLNDTVATLLAGKAAPAGRCYSGYIGYILGTGTNTAYVEKSSAIRKLDPKLPVPQRMIINMESGNFAIKGGPLDDLFRSTTKDPDKYQFEKMISGAYLGPFASLMLEKAVEDGVFSPRFGENFRKLDVLTTRQMSHFLEMPRNNNYLLPACTEGNEADTRNLYVILDSFIARAAKLSACNLAAVVLKTGIGWDPSRPVCINADGTTFYKTENLKRYTDFYLHMFLTRRLGHYYDFVQIKDSPVIGAAIAAMGL